MTRQAPSLENSFPEADLTIVGAGLSGLLTAWRCLSLNPDLTVQIYEREQEIAGDHTWSFNLSDIPEDMRDWFSPFICHQWPRYDVKFPKRLRTLEIPYATGNSDRLRLCIEPYVAAGRLKVRTGQVAPKRLSTPVIHATGYKPRPDEFPGWQKFVGHVIRLETPHGLTHPVIMDARVEQIDGYRFFYLLPFSDHELLVEDTYFSDTPHLSENEISSRIEDYIQDQGWRDYRLIRREKGVLPMMMATDRQDDSAKIGLGGGFAISATGFTVPMTLKTADYIARTIQTQGVEAVPKAIAAFRQQHISNERYARRLNRMFFHAANPKKRYIVLQRFYGLGRGLIRRFYRNELTLRDKARILIGKPPVPVSKAMINLSETAFIRRERAKGQEP